MKNPSAFSSQLVFFGLTLLREMREYICSPVGLALTILNPKMILGELLSLPDLSRAQALFIHKPTEVIIIG